MSFALRMIEVSYDLAFPEKNMAASTDFVLPALMCILIRARLKDPFALQKYLDEFGLVTEKFG